MLLLEEVQKLNRENAERSSSSSSGHQQQQHLTPDGFLDLEAGAGGTSEDSLSPNLLDFILEGPKAPVTEEESLSEEEAAGDGLKMEERKEEEVVKKEEKEHHLNESKEEEKEEELLKTTEKPEEDRRLEEKEGEKEKEGDTTLSKGPSEAVDMSVKDIPSLPTSPKAPGDTNSIPERYSISSTLTLFLILSFYVFLSFSLFVPLSHYLTLPFSHPTSIVLYVLIPLFHVYTHAKQHSKTFLKHVCLFQL